MHGRRPCWGVTLIELLVALSILAVVMTVGVPSFVTLAHNSQTSTLSADLILALTLARSEAIKRGTTVTVCASADGSTCAEDWSLGWIVTAAGEVAPMRVQEVQAVGIGPVEASGLGRVVFGSLGALETAPASFTIGDSTAARARVRVVELAASGRLAVTTTQ